MILPIEEIVREWLIAHGYDGLLGPDECGCHVSDLLPCCECPCQCSPAYDHGPGVTGDGVQTEHLMSEEKP